MILETSVIHSFIKRCLADAYDYFDLYLRCFLFTVQAELPGGNFLLTIRGIRDVPHDFLDGAALAKRLVSN